MDTVVPCICGTKRIDPADAIFELNGVPVCSRECLRAAEKKLTNKRDTIKVPRKSTEWEWNGA